MGCRRRPEGFPLSVAADPCGTILRSRNLESMQPMKNTSLVLLGGIAVLVLLGGCSKPAAPGTAASTEDESLSRSEPQAAAELPAPPQKSQAEQAATLLQFIETRPECQQFRAPLEQASAAPAGQSVELNMGEIMDQAYKAGCQKDPG
jgi:hypothetical protein